MLLYYSLLCSRPSLTKQANGNTKIDLSIDHQHNWTYILVAILQAQHAHSSCLITYKLNLINDYIIHLTMQIKLNLFFQESKQGPTRMAIMEEAQ